ncbi:hypothetical protein EDB19DRAFT_1774785 [Suillus lakei]|nr:hypothetical protein EDB19DRAFT_1774785 [Suillus lakei]
MLNDVAAWNSWTKFVSIQDEYSLLYREVSQKSRNPYSSLTVSYYEGEYHSLAGNRAHPGEDGIPGGTVYEPRAIRSHL